jgi:hypothetical protein
MALIGYGRLRIRLRITLKTVKKTYFGIVGKMG